MRMVVAMGQVGWERVVKVTEEVVTVQWHYLTLLSFGLLSEIVPVLAGHFQGWIFPGES